MGFETVIVVIAIQSHPHHFNWSQENSQTKEYFFIIFLTYHGFFSGGYSLSEYININL